MFLFSVFFFDPSLFFSPLWTCNFIYAAKSGPMTGFYLYFAITKQEFSLGSWRQRIIEVFPVIFSCLFSNPSTETSLIQEKRRRLYEKNDFPITECVRSSFQSCVLFLGSDNEHSASDTTNYLRRTWN
jgi:hypothetical protein